MTHTDQQSLFLRTVNKSLEITYSNHFLEYDSEEIHKSVTIIENLCYYDSKFAYKVITEVSMFVMNYPGTIRAEVRKKFAPFYRCGTF